MMRRPPSLGRSGWPPPIALTPSGCRRRGRGASGATRPSWSGVCALRRGSQRFAGPFASSV
eukprot:2763198-Lingulodinium_polyedra.AAC.1